MVFHDARIATCCVPCWCTRCEALPCPSAIQVADLGLMALITSRTAAPVDALIDGTPASHERPDLFGTLKRVRHCHGPCTTVRYRQERNSTPSDSQKIMMLFQRPSSPKPPTQQRLILPPAEHARPGRTSISKPRFHYPTLTLFLRASKPIHPLPSSKIMIRFHQR
ncbi:hypothetical protein GE09DRAFT_1154254 [Coniochaeta sp. 2T2.1]|nr:hypothetical protein GE09DRAFT_1154254 [Coniochaeta sp. 2T2.1]